MKTIFKYPLTMSSTQTLQMPQKAKILSLQTQNGVPCLWALVETTNQKEPRTFQIIGTGEEITDIGYKEYIGTFQMHGGFLVFHLCELSL